MQKIEAIIRPFKLDEVRDVLSGMGLEGVTISEVRSQAHQEAKRKPIAHGDPHSDFQAKYKIEVVVSDARLSQVKAAIIHAARTGKIGDGRMFVSPMQSAIRIRTEEAGEGVLA